MQKNWLRTTRTIRCVRKANFAHSHLSIDFHTISYKTSLCSSNLTGERRMFALLRFQQFLYIGYCTRHLSVLSCKSFIAQKYSFYSLDSFERRNWFLIQLPIFLSNFCSYFFRVQMLPSITFPLSWNSNFVSFTVSYFFVLDFEFKDFQVNADKIQTYL